MNLWGIWHGEPGLVAHLIVETTTIHLFERSLIVTHIGLIDVLTTATWGADGGMTMDDLSLHQFFVSNSDMNVVIPTFSESFFAFW